MKTSVSFIAVVVPPWGLGGAIGPLGVEASPPNIGIQAPQYGASSSTAYHSAGWAPTVTVPDSGTNSFATVVVGDSAIPAVLASATLSIATEISLGGTATTTKAPSVHETGISLPVACSSDTFSVSAASGNTIAAERGEPHHPLGGRDTETPSTPSTAQWVFWVFGLVTTILALFTAWKLGPWIVRKMKKLMSASVRIWVRWLDRKDRQSGPSNSSASQGDVYDRSNSTELAMLCSNSGPERRSADCEDEQRDTHQRQLIPTGSEDLQGTPSAEQDSMWAQWYWGGSSTDVQARNGGA